MAGFLDIDLKQVAQIVERGGGAAEMALLLDRRRLGVALNDDETAQHRTVFARHFLPGRLALMRAEADLAVFDRRRQEDAPAVFRHADKAEFGPALGFDADGGAQINQLFLETLGAAVAPPIEIARMPALQRAAESGVGIEPDIVRDHPVVIDCRRVAHVRLFQRAGQRAGRARGIMFVSGRSSGAGRYHSASGRWFPPPHSVGGATAAPRVSRKSWFICAPPSASNPRAGPNLALSACRNTAGASSWRRRSRTARSASARIRASRPGRKCRANTVRCCAA